MNERFLLTHALKIRRWWASEVFHVERLAGFGWSTGGWWTELGFGTSHIGNGPSSQVVRIRGPVSTWTPCTKDPNGSRYL